MYFNHTFATTKERVLIHDGNAIEAVRSMQARGYKYSEAIEIMKETRKDLESSRKALSKLNRNLNRRFAPLIRKMTERGTP